MLPALAMRYLARCADVPAESETYARKLMQAPVPVTLGRHVRTFHDFLMLNALVGTRATRAALNQAVAALRRAFRNDG